MVYSQSLAERIRLQFSGRRDIIERRMFGGVGFMLRGHLCVGVWQTSLIARVGPEQAEGALSEPNVRPFDVTGKPMRGWILIEAEAIDEDIQLVRWIELAQDFVSTLPPK